MFFQVQQFGEPKQQPSCQKVPIKFSYVSLALVHSTKTTRIFFIKSFWELFTSKGFVHLKVFNSIFWWPQEKPSSAERVFRELDLFFENFSVKWTSGQGGCSQRREFSTSSLSCPCERVKPVLKACWTPAWSSGSGWWPSVAETSRERNSRSCRLNSSVKQSFGCPRLAGGPGADGPGCRRPVRPRRSKVLVLRELNRSPSGWRELAWLLLTSGSWCSVTRFSVPEKRPRSGCSSGFAGRWFSRCSELGQLKWPGQKISYRNSLPENRGVMAGAVPSGARGPLVQSQLHTNVFSLLSMPEEKWIQSWLMLLSLLSM